jgi:hypothetical protein
MTIATFAAATPAIAAFDRPRGRLDEIALAAWIGQAAPGDRLEYHRGYLALDVLAAVSVLNAPERRTLRQMADRAWWAAEQGLVHLVQARLGPERFAYIAIARPRPKAAAVSLSALLLAEREAA